MLSGFIVSSALVVGLAYYMYVPEADSVLSQQFKLLSDYLRDLFDESTESRAPTEKPDEEGILVRASFIFHFI